MSVSADLGSGIPAASTDMQTQASLHSLWGDLDVLNLDAYTVPIEESDYVDFDELLAQLVQCVAARDADKAAQLLQQLAHPDTPPYAVLGSEQWPELAGLMPVLLTSSCTEVSAAAECLLQQQLAPELLHSSPEPLAQLLTACLSMLSLQAASAAAQGQEEPEAGATVISRPQPVSPAVLHFLISGLQKLGRQWHFLDTTLSEQLCAAVAGMLLQPLLDLLQPLPAQPAAAGAGTAAAQAVHVQQQHDQQSEQAGVHIQPAHGSVLPSEQSCSQGVFGGPGASGPPHHHLLALQLLQVDPMFSWWQRLNVNAASSKPLKTAARHMGIPQLLLQWADHQQQQRGGLYCQRQRELPQHCITSSSASCGDTFTLSQAQHDAAAGPPSPCSPSYKTPAGCLQMLSPLLLHECLAVHCLAGLYGTSSGRRLLQEAADLPGPAAWQGGPHTTTRHGQPGAECCSHDHHQQQQSQQVDNNICHSTHQQKPCHVATSRCPSAPAALLPPAAPQQPLSAVLSCLQGWAQLQQPSEQQRQRTKQGLPFPEWGPVRPDALRTAAAPQSTALTSSVPVTPEAGASSASVSGGVSPGATLVGLQQSADGVDTAAAAAPGGSADSSAEVVVQAAAATAAWAVQACDEQQPWFAGMYVQP